jgi:hypothetical protein
MRYWDRHSRQQSQGRQSRSSRACSNAADAPCMHTTMNKCMPMHHCQFRTLTLSCMHYTWRHLPRQTLISLSQRRQSRSSRACSNAADAPCMHTTVNKCMPMYHYHLQTLTLSRICSWRHLPSQTPMSATVAPTVALLPRLQPHCRCTLHACNCQYVPCTCTAMHNYHFQTLALSC